jgi:uncharacterized protein (TIGR02186 family)
LGTLCSDPRPCSGVSGTASAAESANIVIAQTRKETQGKTQSKTQGNKKKGSPPPAEVGPAPAAKPAAPVPMPAPAATPAPLPPERVEADVSTRSIAVTSGFTGTEIVVFGSVDNSRQPSAESGYYDVVVVVEGTPVPLIARKKSNVAGLWINTAAATFERVPSYYAITSTRPIEEIAETPVLAENQIGMDFALLSPSIRTSSEVPADVLEKYRAAVIRLKQKEGLYIRNDYGVAFIGRSLFRSSIELPANVPVGPLSARVYLFHDGALLSSYTTRVRLEREGIERLLHQFAFRYPLLYGLFAVAVAVAAGLLASAVFRRPVQ